MRAIIQRVDSAVLTVNDKEISKIGKGFLVYLGINENDDENKAVKLAEKVAKIRLFKDENEKLNLSLQDIKGEALVVSNFTIYGDASRGTRPNFMYAMTAKKAKPIYELFLKTLNNLIPTKAGVFKEHMKITQVNNGPINLIIEV